MSVGSIGEYARPGQSERPALPQDSTGWQTAFAAAASGSGGDSAANTGTVGATGGISDVMQAFATMSGQSGGNTDPASASSAADASQATADPAEAGAVHHRHHHKHAGDGSSRDATGLAGGENGQSPHDGTLPAGRIDHPASIAASDMMRALRSYGMTPAAGSGQGTLA